MATKRRGKLGNDSEVVSILRDLLRFDTTNPPGNETACARYLAALFKKEGIPCRVLESAPGRGNVVARLKGGPGKPLMLSAHLDVVPAVGRWTHPPFAAEIHDGCVWGRGAVDMKHMAAMSAVVMLSLKRRGARLKRDLIFAGVADEEAGGRFGAGFLVDKHPDLIRAGWCLTEVGGIATPMGRRMLVPVQVAEKGFVWFKIRAEGPGGHGSQPYPGAAVERLADAVLALSRRPLRYRLTPTTRDFLRAVEKLRSGSARRAVRGLTSGRTARRALARLPAAESKVYNAMLHDTAVVTGLTAGSVPNMSPTHAEATVDGRFLPGTSRRRFLDEVRSVIGPGFEIEVLDGAPALEIRHEGPMWDAIVRVMSRRLPGCEVAPKMLTGQTDAQDFSRLGIKTYGFSPLLLRPGEDFAELYHAPNERVSIHGLETGLTWLTDLVDDFCVDG